MRLQGSLHLPMAVGYSALLGVALVGCALTSLRVHNGSTAFMVAAVLVAAFSPVPAYWHQQGQVRRRDTALIVPWVVLLALTVPVPIIVAARLRLPLCDTAFAAVDHALGLNGPAIIAWAAHHPLGHALNASYSLLAPYFAVAILVSSLCGKREAKRFLLANLIALGIGIFFFALFPAIGPWTSEPFAANAGQVAIEHQVHALRTSTNYLFSLASDGSGIVSFPSYHVIWSVFAASALWGFRWLRVPLALLSAAIICSTLTTGWHYGVDVLGGLTVAAVSLTIADEWFADPAEYHP